MLLLLKYALYMRLYNSKLMMSLKPFEKIINLCRN